MNPEDMSGGTGGAGGSEQVPEAWVGESVVVLLEGDPTPFNGPLLEVNDRGVLIRFFENREELMAAQDRGEEIDKPLYLLYFFPWHKVRAVVRQVEEQESGRQQEREIGETGYTVIRRIQQGFSR